MPDLFEQDNPRENARLKKKKRKKSGKINGYRIAVTILVFLNICAVVLAAYIYFNRKNDYEYLSPIESESGKTGINSDKQSEPSPITESGEQDKRLSDSGEPASSDTVIGDTITKGSISNSVTSLAEEKTQNSTPKIISTEKSSITSKEVSPIPGTIRYTVVASRAHFFNKPDEKTRRSAFINPWNKAILTPLADQNGFIYIVYTNPWGQTSKGWLLKKDLKPLDK